MMRMIALVVVTVALVVAYMWEWRGALFALWLAQISLRRQDEKRIEEATDQPWPNIRGDEDRITYLEPRQ